MESFAERFTAYCKKKGTTPYYVSLDAGFPQSLISEIARGKRKPRLEHLKKLAESELLGVSLDILEAWMILEEHEPSAIREAYRMLGEEDGQ